MLSHRAIIVAAAAVFTVVMTSLASACCVPVAYGSTNSPNPVPLAPAPIHVPDFRQSWAGWGSCGCCGCGTAPSPLYVVDQGPDYTGPGLMEPFRTYTPATVFPYVSGCCGPGGPPLLQPPLIRK
jgi:hypothetical protein